MTKALRHSWLVMIVLACGAHNAAAQNTTAAQNSATLAWDADSSNIDGFALTIDGSRTDLGLGAKDPSGACGCSTPLPVTGGAHTIVVSAYNGSGETPSSAITTAPTANAGGPYSGTTGVALSVDGSLSGSPIGTITQYKWTWGDGSTSTSTSPSASHTYTTAGSFPITLTITDNGGATDSASTAATITAAAPVTPPPPPPSPAPGTPANPSPAAGATSVSTSITLSWSAQGATSYDLRFGTSASPSLIASGLTSTTYPERSLIAGTTYYWQIVARNAQGTTSGPMWTFTTAASGNGGGVGNGGGNNGGGNGNGKQPTTPTTPTAPTSPTTPTSGNCPCSIFTNVTPGTQDPESRSLEIGMKFTSDVDGYITGVRFYKYSANSGPHTGTLWTATGQQLGTVFFTNETDSGWQQANFASPISIDANTVYIISYHTSIGYYASTEWGFNRGFDRGPLHALSTSEAGGNGVYVWKSKTAFPTQTWHASNYWVDVVFTPAP
jgi:hypothetical protein